MLKLEDISVGMRVNVDDLDEIFEVNIILSDLEGKCGMIYYIGDSDTQELESVYDSLESQGKMIRTVYNSYYDL